jgi:hypothetical protein
MTGVAASMRLGWLLNKQTFSNALGMEGDASVKVKDILTDESKWTQGVDARDGYGRRCDPCSSSAVSFCVTGAAMRAYQYSAHAQNKAIRALLRAIPSEYADLESWNDETDRTFDEVRRLIELAGV